MSKVGGSYESVVRGVSQQTPQDRRPGQHEEQVNLISDPVRGLARRWGTRWMAELNLGTFSPSAATVLKQEACAMREYSFTIAGTEYTLLYRANPSAQGSGLFAYCFNKDANTMVPIVYQSGSGWINSLVSGGVSAIANVGQYLYIAGNTTIPTYSQVNAWGATANQNNGVAWVRTGAYSRTYSVSVYKTDGSIFTASYKTKPSAYPTLLDTSDIHFYKPDGVTPDPEYQKNVNDRTNLYNSNVTKYIGDAAADITPENIAAQLQAQLLAHFGAGTVSRVGGTVVMTIPGLADITTDDGGDNSSLLGVANEVNNIDKLSSVHIIGKIVRVRPQGADAKESYYLQAYAKSGAGSGWQEVIWRETAGVQQNPVTMWAMGVIKAGTLYIAQDPTGLNALTGDSLAPPFKPNLVGDGASCPAPNFYGRKITMMTVFQDRLLVGSDGTVTCSRPGDYLNFYRNTVLNIQDDDPVEMFSYGAEGDILRFTTLFNRDLIIFGDQKQYAISGTSVLTPKSPNISVMSSHEYTTQAAPAATGNLVFYGTQREGRTALHQLQVGQLTDSPESYEVSNPLDTYLQGVPTQIVTLTSPNTIIFRTALNNSDMYVYNYLDTPAGQERLFDAWSTWRYNDALGTVVSVSPHKGELLVFTMRTSADNQLFVVADRQSLSTELSPRPHLDSQRKLTTGGIAANQWHFHQMSFAPTVLDVALDNTHFSYLFGDSYSNLASLNAQIPDGGPAMWIGATPLAWVAPTNPFMRDTNSKALVDGRLTLTHITLSVAKTAGFSASVTTVNGSTEWTDFLGRTMGNTDDVIGAQPVVTDKFLVGIGGETRECSYSIHAQTWLPLTITAIGWTGQYFNRVRRAQS